MQNNIHIAIIYTKFWTPMEDWMTYFFIRHQWIYERYNIGNFMKNSKSGANWNLFALGDP